MTAGEICNREIIVIQRDESVLEAARLMRQYHVGSLIVIDRTGGCAKPVGIITDRDLVVEVLATGLDESVVTVGNIMAEELFTVKENIAIHDTVDFMRSKAVRRLPVVDATGELVGILTMNDLLEILSEEILDFARLIRRGQLKETRQRP
ncbi:CBS domain-containing protein [Nitrosomonas sp.]|uniref:CBS domain-containing protein n=1 Tax=Nitrosomonas sp. TaxID=42353 RepID=UPI0025E298A0|nr:CBS domain-containing protein [Nitrosomonas sp.]